MTSLTWFRISPETEFRPCSWTLGNFTRHLLYHRRIAQKLVAGRQIGQLHLDPGQTAP